MFVKIFLGVVIIVIALVVHFVGDVGFVAATAVGGGILLSVFFDAIAVGAAASKDDRDEVDTAPRGRR